jgi:hypothetical protein
MHGVTEEMLHCFTYISVKLVSVFPALLIAKRAAIDR